MRIYCFWIIVVMFFLDIKIIYGFIFMVVKGFLLKVLLLVLFGVIGVGRFNVKGGFRL